MIFRLPQSCHDYFFLFFFKPSLKRVQEECPNYMYNTIEHYVTLEILKTICLDLDSSHKLKKCVFSLSAQLDWV